MPVRPPQPVSSPGAVDQLTTPITSGAFAVISGRAGIAGAATEADALVAGGDVVKADLQRTRLAGDGQCRHARLAKPARGSRQRHAEAGNGERFAWRDAPRRRQ